MNDTKVNLFIVGAMKAGTTSFVELLSQHQDIFVPPVKEPHFFVDAMPQELYEPNKFFSLENYLEHEFPNPLHITKVETIVQYQRVYSQHQGETYQLDGSTAYLHAIESAQKIYEYNPEAKIIVLLRDPLERSFSHYKMDLGKGRTKASFDSIMQEEIDRYHSDQLSWYGHLGMSFYREPIARYQKLFKRVLLLQLDDLINYQDTVLRDISSFLEIESFSDSVVSHKNSARKPLFPRVVFFLKKAGLHHYFSKVFSSTFKQWLTRRISSEDKFELKLSEETKLALEQIFKKESQI